jgi:hypothetical protein
LCAVTRARPDFGKAGVPAGDYSALESTAVEEIRFGPGPGILRQIKDLLLRMF